MADGEDHLKLVAEYDSIPAERTLRGASREAYELLRNAQKSVLEVELAKTEAPATMKRAFQRAAKACNRQVRFETDAKKPTAIFVQWSGAGSVGTAAVERQKLKYDWPAADVQRSAAAMGYDTSREPTERQLRAARKRITDFDKRSDFEGAFKLGASSEAPPSPERRHRVTPTEASTPPPVAEVAANRRSGRLTTQAR